MEHYLYDFSEHFAEKVVDNFVHAYETGATPNPCIECNKHIKFGSEKYGFEINTAKQNKNFLVLQSSDIDYIFKEIVSEGWGAIDLDITYNENGITYSTTSTILNQMLTNKSNTYKELELTGKYNDSLGDMMKSLLNINENNINVATFMNIKNEFDALLNSFPYSNTANTSTIKINNEQALIAGKYIDITDFDNVIFNDEIMKAYSVVNKLIFNYDVKNDELIYDYPTINATINVSEITDSIDLEMNIELINDYNEKVVYNVKVSK